MTNDQTVTQAIFDQAASETERLQRELDITNADHIALWIEANLIADEPMSQCVSWFACRIVEAYERTAHSGEGRSNGAGEDAELIKSLRTSMLFDSQGRCTSLPYDAADAIERLAALSAPQGEVERLRAEVADYRKLTAEQQKRIGKLEGAIMARPPIKPDDGSWWYPEGDTSSDACCHGPAEALEGAADQMAEGEARVVVLERALELPNVYAALRVFTDAERDERDDDEPWDFTLHATADDARAALAQPEAGGER